ncbi:MAG TPA: hypothetical protein VKU44_06080 [Terriglobia bacterium]|nr:hypothetical protein [Terriglobia bacterium]
MPVACVGGVERPPADSGKIAPAVGTVAIVAALVMLGLAGGSSSAYGRDKKPKGAEFLYLGGTEAIRVKCNGRVELGQQALTYKCEGHVIVIPYASIVHMQYRNDISKDILTLDVRWWARPELERVKDNRYFTIEYRAGEAIHIMVFDVRSEVMIPYFAEIDLKSGKRVEVRGYESYDN